MLGFSDSSVGKESTCNAGDPCSIPGSGRYLCQLLVYFCMYVVSALQILFNMMLKP